MVAVPQSDEINAKGGEGAAVKVRDAMTEHVLTMTPGRTLREAARFLS